MQITAVTTKNDNSYIGWIEEIPGANSQATTLEELYENLTEAAEMVVTANREIMQENFEKSALQKKLLDVRFAT